MKWTLLLVAALVFSNVAYSQQKEDMNFKGERARVKQGIKSGEITRREAAKIHKEKQDVRQAKQNAKADGVVTVEERKEVAKQDRQLDKTIKRTKHNNRRR
ncbi:MAG: hypothetical protein ACK5UE_05365 [Chitinophagales bacterium]|jgi:hypothetical protein|nr:hypothetical protein [Sphingobacteriales bacterium]